MLDTLRGLTAGERDLIANLSNASAVLMELLPSLNWAGFYLLKKGVLVLGPFQGKPACIRIPVGKGVCGTAAENKETICVPDVHAFPGHIACDQASRSEIVVPLITEGRLAGVMDLDSPMPGRFGEDDAEGLKKIAELLEEACDWACAFSC
ncbi:MAG: GAF domain-containing protein [Parasporobacterium sp.]|nr:GAF domain-containing protein [Parasporobacterium sp.]